ncbi:cytochrome P450 [Archangium violaceum]|uniref:cytochrome P450 n=1 Tax=Archangium violaceum TaxID=83451 RepID=UPI0019509D38|nr:cytochrome P450 [Archangium violaceum]QRN99251.1 cytochrome P450 [Archangium violaceum]
MSNRFNLLAPDVRANPYPVYAELRRNRHLCQVDPGGMWAVTRYADVMTVMKNPLLFSSEGFGRAVKPAWLGHNPFADSMICMDPPNHTRLRALVNRVFGAPALARWEPRVRFYAEKFASRIPAGRTVDAVESFTSLLPSSIIGELLGLDASLRPRFRRWTDDLTSITGTAPDDLAKQAQVRDTVAEFEQYVSEVLELRRREPREDLVSDLLRARVESEALTEAEVHSFLFMLLVAGLETTVHLLSHTLRLLAEHPEVLARVRANRSLIPQLLEEVLRCETPVHSVPRHTTADTELGGVPLPKGSRLLVVLASASRDEEQFPNGERFDPERSGQHNLSFGHGIHFCLGAQLARMEARLGLEALLDHFSGFSKDPEPVVWNRSMTVRGPVVLPLRFHAA